MNPETTVATEIAILIGAIRKCKENGNTIWLDKHTNVLRKIEKELLPSGSGFDCGTQVDLDKSTPRRLVLNTSYHHMDTHGGYDGWTSHQIIVTPEFDGVDVVVKGVNRNDIKDYAASTLMYMLMDTFDHVKYADPIYKAAA